MFFNVANWATLTAPWLMLLSVAREARNRREALFDIALLVIAGLSTPFSICLWLLFAVRLTIRRTRFSAILFAVSLVIAALQLWHMGGRVAEPEAEPLLYRIDDLAYRLGFVFFGEALYRLRLDLTSRVVLLGGFGLAYATAARRAWTSGSHPASVFLLAHVLVVAVSYFVTRTWAETDFVAHTGRHQYLPAVTLVWAMACLRMVPAQWIPVGLAFAAFVFLNPANKRDVWPDLHWREQLARCRVQSGPCQIPIHPLTRPPQVWTVTVTGTP